MSWADKNVLSKEKRRREESGSYTHLDVYKRQIIRFGELKIYLQERIVKKNDSDVHLSKYEYDILLLLAKSPGRIFGKEMVYDLVWNEPYSGDYNVVMRHICNIREKIEDDPGQPLYIQTVRGVGSVSYTHLDVYKRQG